MICNNVILLNMHINEWKKSISILTLDSWWIFSSWNCQCHNFYTFYFCTSWRVIAKHCHIDLILIFSKYLLDTVVQNLHCSGRILKAVCSLNSISCARSARSYFSFTVVLYNKQVLLCLVFFSSIGGDTLFIQHRNYLNILQLVELWKKACNVHISWDGLVISTEFDSRTVPYLKYF